MSGGKALGAIVDFLPAVTRVVHHEDNLLAGKELLETGMSGSLANARFRLSVHVFVIVGNLVEVGVG